MPTPNTILQCEPHRSMMNFDEFSEEIMGASDPSNPMVSVPSFNAPFGRREWSDYWNKVSFLGNKMRYNVQYNVGDLPDEILNSAWEECSMNEACGNPFVGFAGTVSSPYSAVSESFDSTLAGYLGNRPTRRRSRNVSSSR